MSASAVRRLTAAGLASLAIGAVLAAPAMAGPLDRAEQAARAATLPSRSWPRSASRPTSSSGAAAPGEPCACSRILRPRAASAARS